MKPETEKTFKVAILLCLVCSVVVSTLAVNLKPIQQKQKEAFRKRSVLEAAGLWRDGMDPLQVFDEKIKVIQLDLEDYRPESGSPSDPKFDLAKSLQDPRLHRTLDPAEDIAGLKKLEKATIVYEVKRQDSDPPDRRTVILPIRGKGLWSTLYGYIALDLKVSGGPEDITIRGLTYYRHGETPGLGGEVENPIWKQKWPGKKVYDSNWDVRIEVTKSASPDSPYQVDALSGATLTSNGVTNMLRFWLGPKGFLPWIQQLVGAPSDTPADAQEQADFHNTPRRTVLEEVTQI